MAENKAQEKFLSQLTFEPRLVNEKNFQARQRLLFVGMGSSRLSADLLGLLQTDSKVLVHSDYGLPANINDHDKDLLVVLSSYSGQTEETLNAGERAVALGLPIVAVTGGGKLLSRAKKASWPYILLPDKQILSRQATGYFLKSFSHLAAYGDLSDQLSNLGQQIDPDAYLVDSQRLADKINSKIPLFYSTSALAPLAWFWKLKINETGQHPAFTGILPDINHSELAGFSRLSNFNDLFTAFFLEDPRDSVSIKKKMALTIDWLRDHGVGSTKLSLEDHQDRVKTICHMLILAEQTAQLVAERKNIDPNDSGPVGEFKDLAKKSRPN